MDRGGGQLFRTGAAMEYVLALRADVRRRGKRMETSCWLKGCILMDLYLPVPVRNEFYRMTNKCQHGNLCCCTRSKYNGNFEVVPAVPIYVSDLLRKTLRHNQMFEKVNSTVAKDTRKCERITSWFAPGKVPGVRAPPIRSGRSTFPRSLSEFWAGTSRKHSTL
ncbi:unnamed protein product, partial [Nesidiocoris tenuis]